jgi:hypothetical protein
MRDEIKLLVGATVDDDVADGIDERIRQSHPEILFSN